MVQQDIEGIKRPIASLYPTGVEMRCVEIMIPDDDSYLQILAGFVSILGKNWAWQGTPEEREARAQLWQQAYAATDWDGCMECEDVADCIETSEEVQDALEQNLINNINNSTGVQNALNNVYNQFGSNPMPGTVSGTDLIPGTVLCDPNKTWGAIVQLIDSMHQNNIDSFEVAEVATNLAERAALIFSAVPILETLPVNEAVDYIQGIWTDDLFEAYEANDTTAYRDTLKCDLFCIATSGDCSLSIDNVFQYFINRISGDAADTFAELIAYLISGTWAGTEINDMFFAGQILLMKYGNQFFGNVGIRPYQAYLEIGSRSPSDAWELICDTCPADFCYEWDNATEFSDWTILSFSGETSTIVDNKFVGGLSTDGLARFIYVSLQIDSTIHHIEVDWEALTTIPTNGIQIAANGAVQIFEEFGAETSGTLVWDGTQTGNIDWTILAGVNVVNETEYIRITRIQIAGNGDYVPPEGEACP